MKTSLASPDNVWIIYETFDEWGNLLDSSGNRPIEVNTGLTHPRILTAIKGLRPGAEAVVNIPSAEAFGPIKKDLLIWMPTAGLEVKTNQLVTTAVGAEGRVITVEGDQMLVDTNHPFAGRDLTIRLRVSASVAGNDTSSCCGPEGCC